MINKGLVSSRHQNKERAVVRKQIPTEVNLEAGWSKPGEQYRILKEFLVRHVDRSKLLQLQVFDASGFISIMGCEVNGNLVGFFDDAEKLFKVVRSIATDKVKYKNIFVNLNREVAPEIWTSG